MIAAAVAAGIARVVDAPALDLGVLQVPSFTLAFALASDFANFVNHALHHRLAILWPLHSLHHSAQALNPLTLYRKHPLYDAVQGLIKTPIAGVLQGAELFVFLGDPGLVTILGMNAVFSLFHLMGSNLRHSHVWASFGPVLERVFVSRRSIRSTTASARSCATATTARCSPCGTGCSGH